MVRNDPRLCEFEAATQLRDTWQTVERKASCASDHTRSDEPHGQMISPWLHICASKQREEKRFDDRCPPDWLYQNSQSGIFMSYGAMMNKCRQHVSSFHHFDKHGKRVADSSTHPEPSFLKSSGRWLASLTEEDPSRLVRFILDRVLITCQSTNVSCHHNTVAENTKAYPEELAKTLLCQY